VHGFAKFPLKMNDWEPPLEELKLWARGFSAPTTGVGPLV